MTCLRSHSCEGVKPGFEPKRSGGRHDPLSHHIILPLYTHGMVKAETKTPCLPEWEHTGTLRLGTVIYIICLPTVLSNQQVPTTGIG